MTDIDIVHIHDADRRNLCGDQSGDSITLDEARDPDDDKHFTCGACWRALSGGVEPMGGSRQ